MKHSQSFEIRFCEVDRNSRLTPIALFNFLQEVAIGHGDAVGMDGETLGRMGYAWMMNRVHMQIDRYPVRLETVHVQTWAFTLVGLYAIREWKVTDAAGECIARATARWIIFDIAKKKIVKLPAILPERYGEHEDRALEDPFLRMKPIAEGENRKSFHVRLSELDTNQHANSACYIDWCLEAVPDEIQNGYLPHSVEVTFKKESKLGEALESTSLERESDTADERVFEHAVALAEKGDLLTMGRSTWRKIE